MPEGNAPDNGILMALPAEAYERLRPDLKPVKFKSGEVLYRPGQPLRHVYFPRDLIVAEVYFAADGNTSAIGVIGREGLVGMSSFLSGIETATEALVIGTGTAFRLGIHALEREFERGQEFQRLLLHFTQAFVAQAGQIAVCTRHHSVEQQLCGWLLMYLERASSDELRLTQDLISGLLGVRREAVTRAALKLKEDGLLDYMHGRVKVLDVARLKVRACGCHRVIKNAYETLLPPPPPEITRDESQAAGARECVT